MMFRGLVSVPLRRLSGFAGLNGVNNAEDFLPVAQRAVKKTTELISGIEAVKHGPDVVSVLDEISDSVCRVADVANFCYCVHPDENWRRHSSYALQHLVKYISQLNTNEELFSALKASLEDRVQSGEWDSEAIVVGESLYRDFVSCGMGSNRKEEIHNLIALEHKLGMNFQKCATEHQEVKALSLPNVFAIPSHLETVFIQHAGEYHMAMTPSNYSAVMHAVQDESIRKAAYLTHFQSLQQNTATLNELLIVRNKWAQELGWDSFAHFKLQDSLAVDPMAVDQFLKAVAKTTKPEADQEISRLADMKGSPIHQWDVPYFTSARRKEVLQNYKSNILLEFNLQTVINGISRLLLELMDIEMVQLNEEDVWDSSVQVFAFRQASEEFSDIGHLYMDLMGRSKKRPENAHYTLRCGRTLANGRYQTPIVALVTNFANYQISFFELKTFLHEFGHVLHSMLSKTRFQHLFGTRGPLDLVEIPSHFFERLGYHAELLQYLAGIDRRGNRPVSLDALGNTIKANSMFMNIRTQEQLQIALADQMLHGTAFHEKETTTTEVMEMVQEEIGSIPFVPGTFKEAWLTHLTTYGARYYAYILSRHIANIAWNQHIGPDLFNKPKWKFVREHLFQPGGAIKPQEYVWNLIGRDRLVKQQQGWIPK